MQDENFCKLCHTPAPKDAVNNPTIIFINQDDEGKKLTLHFNCIDRDVIASWKRAKKPKLLKDRGLRDSILTEIKQKGGLLISNFDFVALQEAHGQDDNKGVSYKKMLSRAVVKALIDNSAHATEEQQKYQPAGGNGVHSVPTGAAV